MPEFLSSDSSFREGYHETNFDSAACLVVKLQNAVTICVCNFCRHKSEHLRKLAGQNFNGFNFVTCDSAVRAVDTTMYTTTCGFSFTSADQLISAVIQRGMGSGNEPNYGYTGEETCV